MRLVLLGLGFLIANSYGLAKTIQGYPRPTPTDVVDKRLADILRLYEHSAELYQQDGPLSFWKSFAFLANEEELLYLNKATKSYPELPILKLKDSRTIDLYYWSKVQATISIVDFDQQVYKINSKNLVIPYGASIEEIVSVFEASFPVSTASVPFWKKYLEDFLFVRTANAFASWSKNGSSNKRGFFSRLFGAGAHGMNGVRSAKAPRNVSPSRLSHGGTSSADIAYGASLGSDTPRAPIPNGTPTSTSTVPSYSGTTPVNFTTTRETNKYYTGKGNPSGSLKIDTLSGPLGSDCTIVFARHGQKQYPGTQRLTSKTGKQQAEALAFAMEDFSRQHGEFDYVFHSAEERSKQTAAPFLQLQNTMAENAKSGAPLTLKDFNECTSKDGVSCSSRGKDVFAELKQNYCKGGKKIFISGHGEMGLRLLNAMGVSPSTYPDCARPYVVAVNSGEPNKLIHQPKTGADQGSKSMCNKRSSSADEV